LGNFGKTACQERLYEMRKDVWDRGNDGPNDLFCGPNDMVDHAGGVQAEFELNEEGRRTA
jgi:hypothetical protein